MISAFRSIFETKQGQFVPIEEFVKFIANEFCSEERDILVSMLVALDLKSYEEMLKEREGKA
jgi:hypothetical protein